MFKRYRPYCYKLMGNLGMGAGNGQQARNIHILLYTYQYYLIKKLFVKCLERRILLLAQLIGQIRKSNPARNWFQVNWWTQNYS